MADTLSYSAFQWTYRAILDDDRAFAASIGVAVLIIFIVVMLILLMAVNAEALASGL